MEYRHYRRPLVFVVFTLILPFIYTQNAPEDRVSVQNVARKEVGFFTKCGPDNAAPKCGPDNASPKCGPDNASPKCGPDKAAPKCGPDNAGAGNDIEPDDGNVTSKPEDYVNAHNIARKEVGADPIEWNTTLAEFAQNYANQRKDCVLVHSERNGGMYGENCCWGGAAKDAVTMWVGEKPFWDAATQTCAPGKVCGHYTQVIAPDSTQVGCGRVKCTTQKYAYFVTCNYYAPPKDETKKPKEETGKSTCGKPKEETKKYTCGDRKLF